MTAEDKPDSADNEEAGDGLSTFVPSDDQFGSIGHDPLAGAVSAKKSHTGSIRSEPACPS